MAYGVHRSVDGFYQVNGPFDILNNKEIDTNVTIGRTL